MSVAIAKIIIGLYKSGFIWIAVLIFVVAIIYYYYNKPNESDSANKTPSSASSQDSDVSKTIIKPQEHEVNFKEHIEKPPYGCLPKGCLLHGTYRITRYISHGGFGNTYMAKNIHTESVFAIKELFHKEVCERDVDGTTVIISNANNKVFFRSLVSKFMKEAGRLQQFNTPNIVKVYECFEENATAYYVMDYIEGRSMAQIIKENGKVPEHTVRTWLPDMLGALGCIHSQNILHLDLKPANFMVSSSNRVVLIDFGASKQYYDEEGNTLSSSSVMCYTAGYAPLEQISGNQKNIGAWTDIYALGATLYTLLCGVRPPLADEIMSDGITFVDGVSDNFIVGIDRMMNPNRKNRPQSVSEVAELLNMQH